MRQAVALLSLATMVAGLAACADAPVTRRTTTSRSGAIDRPVAMATPSPRAGDAAVTRQVCAAAVRAATLGLRVFDEQMAILERAAAGNDEATMIGAATVLTGSLLDLAATFDALSRQSSKARVRVALRRTASALAVMGSESYLGTSADQRRELAALPGTVAKACA